MGQVFYDMGFLSSPEVHDCSATDLVAGYVGQTGKKTIQLLEKALGQVLFIDEAYRLGEGAFATEAVNELVDSLTKPRFVGKIVVILAGYEGDMNRLLSTNPGLSSRFAEEVMFKNMEPRACMILLEHSLRKTRITVEEGEAGQWDHVVLELFRELSSVPGWGNGRDIQTLAKSIAGGVFRSANGTMVKLSLTKETLVRFLRSFLAERKARSIMTTSKLPRPELTSEAWAQVIQSTPAAPRSLQSTTVSEAKSTKQDEILAPPVLTSTSSDERDDNVSDSVWTQLQADKAAERQVKQQRESALAAAEERVRTDKVKEEELGRVADHLAAQKVRDEEANELMRRREEARLKYVAAQRAREELEARLARAREEGEKRRKEEAKAQQKLRDMGMCEAGFRWIKQGNGYRCGGGSHFVSNAQLGM